MLSQAKLPLGAAPDHLMHHNGVQNATLPPQCATKRSPHTTRGRHEVSMQCPYLVKSFRTGRLPTLDEGKGQDETPEMGPLRIWLPKTRGKWSPDSHECCEAGTCVVYKGATYLARSNLYGHENGYDATLT